MGSFREWVKRAEPLAYGELGLLPDQFYALTPGEFNAIVRARALRQKREHERALGYVALIVATVNSPHVKSPRSPKWYLDRWLSPGPGSGGQRTLTDMKNDFKKLWAKVVEQKKRAGVQNPIVGQA